MTYDSAAEKHWKKQRLEAEVQLQKGALDKYVVKGSQTNSENQTSDANIDDAVEVEAPAANIDEGDDGHGDDVVEVDAPDAEINEGDEGNIANENHDPNISDDIDNFVQPDIFDPRNWDGLDSRKIDILLQKGPKRESIEHGRYDKFSRRFSALSYTRILLNGEKCDREWLLFNQRLNLPLANSFCVSGLE
jgi:hypothetical protein